jgi:hypothetical protein
MFPQPARACERDSLAVRLPGETSAEFEKRDNKIYADQDAARRFGQEQQAYEHAPTIFIAKVISGWVFDKSTQGPPTAVVRPLKAIKGILPQGDVTLVEFNTGGLCSNKGDGRGAFAKEGELVIVFEGLPKHDLQPNGVYSLPASLVRSDDLLIELAHYLGVTEF